MNQQRKEELEELKKHPHHYLWNKCQNDWTDKDRQNLFQNTGRRENPTTRPVVVIYGDKKQQFESIIDAARGTGIGMGSIRYALTQKAGHYKDMFFERI